MATDYGPAMVNSARKTLAPFDGRAGASQADATALPFEDQRFDLVLSCGMLHHVGDDEAGGLVARLQFFSFRSARSRRFVLDVDDGRPEQFDHGVVSREVSAGLGDLAQLVVQAFDAVGGVEQLADRRCEGEEQGEAVPGGLEDADGLGVFCGPSRCRRRRPARRRQSRRWPRCRSS